MAIIQASDFVGVINVSKNKHETSDLDLFISTYEKKYMIDLFGFGIYENFIADLTVSTPQTPQTSPFTDIFTDFEIEHDHSYGLKYMLEQFVYFEWLNVQWLKKTASGVVAVDSENSTVRGATRTQISTKYNDAVKQYKLIQCYINDNIDLFETGGKKFTGVEKNYIALI